MSRFLSHSQLATALLAVVVFCSPLSAQLLVTDSFKALKKTKLSGEQAATKQAQAKCELSRGPVSCKTAIDWYLPEDAVKLARHEEKLLIVLHLSGNFEKEDFT